MLRSIWERLFPRARRTARARLVARNLGPGPFDRVRRVLAHPGLAGLAAVSLLITLGGTAIIGLSRERLPAATGRVADRNYVVRVDFKVPDRSATERAREARRVSIPRIYVPVEKTRQELEASIRGLPSALAAAQNLDQVADEIRANFRLTPDQLDEIREGAADPHWQQSWVQRVDRLMDLLARRPLLGNEDFQLLQNDPATSLEIVRPDASPNPVHKDRALNAEGDLSTAIAELVRAAEFRGGAAQVVAQRLTVAPSALYVFDRAETETRRQSATAVVPEQFVVYRRGDVLARRGELIRQETFELIAREHSEYLASRPPAMRAAGWGGAATLATVAVAGLILCLRLFSPRLLREGWRMLGLALFVLAGAAIGSAVTDAHPAWSWVAPMVAVVLVAMPATVALSPVVGLLASGATSLLIWTALDLPAAAAPVMLIAASLAAWRLRDIRSRHDVVIGAAWVGLGIIVAVLGAGALTRPVAGGWPGVWGEIVGDAAWAGLGGFFCGALTLVALPAIERIFSVTTGMTLSEWRDTKQPLLRRLQLLAPGTFNHSHTVAALAEAAAESVGADGLHVYVGALYHDAGKMNKPDYFVENQTGGPSKHAKLSPAMSLLVIVGHVKDGLELAREYRLPRSLLGYIETHHGTTLVEYFFDRARRQAEAGDEEDSPSEIEYRYPGPKPRTREQAILMIADAVEGATRAMPEPTPSRIAALVHSLAQRRLMDGQFDECELTLRELNQIEEAVTRTLTSIYHGRVAYPRDESKADRESPDPSERPKTAAAERSA